MFSGLGRLLARVAALTLFTVSSTISLAAAPIATTHPSGIEILPTRQPGRAPQLSEDLLTAFDDAESFADSDSTSFGNPYIDATVDTIVLRATDSSSAQRAGQWRPRASVAQTKTRVEMTARSRAALTRIADEILTNRISFPDGELIWATTNDYEGNRALLLVDHLSDRLLYAVAAKYGTQSVAVTIQRDPKFQNASRYHDVSPYWGGAAIATPQIPEDCTSAFAASLNGYARVITAGHCVSKMTSDAIVFNGDLTQQMGRVYFNPLFYNYAEGIGTTAINGSYDGDLALITLDAGRTGGTAIYTGGLYDETYASVKEMWWRAPAYGDQYCTGGRTSGAKCSWEVIYGNTNITKNGGILRNVSWGQRYNGCGLASGDSGGSVYTVRPDGGIAAKGVSSQSDGCYNMIFTDIRRLTNPWPGITIDLQL